MPNKRNEFTPGRLELVREYMRTHPGEGCRRVGRALNIPRASADRAIRMLRIKGAVAAAPEAPPALGHRYDSYDNSASLVTANPATLAGLLKACQVDLKTWRVKNWVANKWEVGTKNPDNGKVRRTPLYQIKAWLERIPGAAEAEVMRDTIEWIKDQRVVPQARTNSPMRLLAIADPVMLEISIPDLHLGKLSWKDETNENYDSAIASSLYIEATKQLWAKASVFPVEKILIVAGSDFFNVDNSRNETTAGTPQSEDGRWPKTFRRGVALLHHQIEMLRGKTPGGIDVVMIQGNHDVERIFYAGEVLKAVYANTRDVRVTNNPIKRQYIQWGTVMLGLTHGDGIKHDKLPLLMAGEAPQMWASTTHRETHLGHLHHARETRYATGSEHSAVRVRVLPSLTAADNWHFNNGYTGQQRAAEAYLWAKKAGYVGHLSWSVQ